MEVGREGRGRQAAVAGVSAERRRLRDLAGSGGARVLVLGLAAAVAAVALVGCAGTAAARVAGEEGALPIHVYAREDGSGTRGAFVDQLGIRQEDADGQRVDRTVLDAAVTNSTFVMLSSVAGDPGAIGYASLGSLLPDSAVRIVPVDGVAPTADAVRDGSYPVTRSLTLVTGGNVSPEAAGFLAFVQSDQGRRVVEDAGYVAVPGGQVPGEPGIVGSSDAAGKVVVAGSSSVAPVMEQLAGAYEALNPGAKVEVQQSDSTTGVAMALAGTCDIGMSSRDLAASEEAAGAVALPLARDGIAVIVSPSCPVDGLSSAQVRAIYLGVVTDWADV